MYVGQGHSAAFWANEYIGTYDYYSNSVWQYTWGPTNGWISFGHDAIPYTDSQYWWNSWSNDGTPNTFCVAYADMYGAI